MAQTSARWGAPLFSLFVVGHLIAQVVLGVQAFGQRPKAPAREAPASLASKKQPEASFRPMLEASLQLCAALPAGKSASHGGERVPAGGR